MTMLAPEPFKKMLTSPSTHPPTHPDKGHFSARLLSHLQPLGPASSLQPPASWQGSPYYNNVRPLCYSDSDAVLLCFDTSQPHTVDGSLKKVDIGALQWVEELEQRVITADLHFKVAPESGIVKAESAEVDPDLPVVEFEPYTAPEADSTRSDLRYYEHQADPRDDWTVRTKREWSDVPRVVTHPLDLAVLRLANLERHVQRRYLKEPLWNAAEVMRLAPVTPTPGEAPPMDVMR
ncbi:hypothetical protein CRUP_012105 [Coryphaenoides rupestris]|nr:hypothetical protein CRUP_012105 [Coryphaenoides rupestris]